MKRTFLSFAVVAMLAGCATTATLPDDQRLEIHRAHAGAPVNSFHNLGTLYSWTPLGDSALAVWTRRNQAYLLELGGRCPGLEYGRAISFSGQGGAVYAGMDNVVVLANAPNLENAKLFQNFIMDPENAAMISDFAKYANGIMGSEKFLDPGFAEAPEIKIPEGAPDPEFVPPCPQEVTQMYDKIWTNLLK